MTLKEITDAIRFKRLPCMAPGSTTLSASLELRATYTIPSGNENLERIAKERLTRMILDKLYADRQQEFNAALDELARNFYPTKESFDAILRLKLLLGHAPPLGDFFGELEPGGKPCTPTS